MKKTVTLILTVVMLLSLFSGAASADWQKRPARNAETPAEDVNDAGQLPAGEANEIADALTAELAAVEEGFVFETMAYTGEVHAEESEDTLAEDAVLPGDALEEVEAEDEALPDETAGGAEAEESPDEEDVFVDWNKDAPALSTLIEYVEAVTDETDPDYIPVADRIAVFDMDGTLYGELFPTYLEYYMLAWRILKDQRISPDAEMLALGRELRESVISHSFASDMPIRHAQQAARAYAGMTMKEFAAFVNEILIRDVDGFEGMTYATAFYQPMLEVIDYLQDNDFTVYVVSGSDRAICRSLLEGMIDIPYANIIGMDVGYEATGQGDTDGLDYVFKADDEVVRTDRLIIKNLKMNKVLQIVQDIGQKPVLSFGNSSGDVSMHMYTISNNPYRSAAFMLIADDETRDYGNEQKVQSLKKEWEADGFHVISMKNDFRTIYGDEVVKTGSFHWTEELAENRVALENSPVWVASLPQAQDAEQLMVVAGVGETTAWVSLHEKAEDGSWKQIMTTPGYIGKSGLGKAAEGDARTPVGTFRFNAAFGVEADPGCALPYHQVTALDYWSGDQRDGYHYNEMVSIKDLPDLNTGDSEHLIDYREAYRYALNISYNEEGTPGLGSAIFLHCLREDRPFTGGCVAIPQEQMLSVMQHVIPNCVVVIDSLANLSPETWNDWGLAPAGTVEPREEGIEPPVDKDKAEEAAEPENRIEDPVEVEAVIDDKAVGNGEPAEKAEEIAEPEEEIEEAADSEEVVLSASSELFTEEELAEAIVLIGEEFDTWEGCEMHMLTYVGDESNTPENLKWLNSLHNGHSFTRCAQFVSNFHSPVEGGGAWEPDAEYVNWEWWLACDDAGEWALVTWGY